LQQAIITMRIILLIIILITISITTHAQQSLSDEQIKNILIQQSISYYLSSIGNCPCPYNRDRVGRTCGKRSAWSRVGGYSPLCYPNDVTQEM